MSVVIQYKKRYNTRDDQLALIFMQHFHMMFHAQVEKIILLYKCSKGITEQKIF